MRKNLKPLNDIRKRFKGTIDSFGTKRGWGGRELQTILLIDVIDLSTNKKVTEHLWFNLTKGFQKLNLKEGDIIKFDARVKSYLKGYRGYREDLEFEKPIETDYKLSHPNKIEKVKK